MQDVIGNLLREKLKDVKVTVDGEEKDLLPIVFDWEEYLGKLKTANADLVSQREKWDQERKQFKTTIGELEKVKGEIEGKLKEKEGSSGKKSQEFEELQKQFNTVNERLESLTKLYEEEKTKAEQLQTQSREAMKTGSLGDLRAKVLAELGKHKIVGSQADAALAVIESKGLAKVIDGDNGAFVPTFATIKDGKSFSATLESMCKQFAEDNPYFVAPSGTRGPGANHESGGNSGALAFTGKESTQELRNMFRQNL